MPNLISMSLYGDSPMYLQGALANAFLREAFYPGWGLRFYCSDDVDTTLLEKEGCEIRRMGVSRKHAGMLWRFLAAWDEGYERVIFRDADSRFNPREVAAVKAWEASGLKAHCMHDHPHHACLPIFGGMWGIKTGVLPIRLRHMIVKMATRDLRRVEDMKFLQREVLPYIQKSILRHSSVPVKWLSEPFPPHDEWKGFVGQQYDDEGKPVWA